VYHFCRQWHDRAKAIKGQEELTDGRFYRASKIDINSRTGSIIKNGLVLWNLNVTQYKDKISRLVASKDPTEMAFVSKTRQMITFGSVYR
jgi:ribosomal protein L15E